MIAYRPSMPLNWSGAYRIHRILLCWMCVKKKRSKRVDCPIPFTSFSVVGSSAQGSAGDYLLRQRAAGDYRGEHFKALRIGQGRRQLGFDGGLLGNWLPDCPIRKQWVPDLWEGKFGYSPVIRWAASFSGGVLLGIGARWADGCTSGHGISGTLQLIVSSWIAVLCFFIGGVVIAHMIY